MGPGAATPASWEENYDAEVAAEKAAAEKAAGGQPPPDATIAFPSTSQLMSTAQLMVGAPGSLHGLWEPSPLQCCAHTTAETNASRF